MSICNICKRELNDPGDPTTKNCGGDCVRCMADYGEDPDCISAMYKITGDKKYGDIVQVKNGDRHLPKGDISPANPGSLPGVSTNKGRVVELVDTPETPGKDKARAMPPSSRFESCPAHQFHVVQDDELPICPGCMNRQHRCDCDE